MRISPPFAAASHIARERMGSASAGVIQAGGPGAAPAPHDARPPTPLPLPGRQSPERREKPEVVAHDRTGERDDVPVGLGEVEGAGPPHVRVGREHGGGGGGGGGGAGARGRGGPGGGGAGARGRGRGHAG